MNNSDHIIIVDDRIELSLSCHCGKKLSIGADDKHWIREVL